MRSTGSGDETASTDELCHEMISESATPALVIDPVSERIESANDAFLAEHGWPRRNLMGSDYRVCLDPADWPAVARCLERLARGHPTGSVTVRMRRFDGTTRRSIWSGVPSLSDRKIGPVTLVARNSSGLGAIPPTRERDVPSRRLGIRPIPTPTAGDQPRSAASPVDG